VARNLRRSLSGNCFRTGSADKESAFSFRGAHSVAVSARKELRPIRPRAADPMAAQAGAQIRPGRSADELNVPAEHRPLGQRPPPPFLSWDDYYLYLSDPAGAASAVRTSLPKLG
jgi:hypothetical protein